MCVFTFFCFETTGRLALEHSQRRNISETTYNSVSGNIFVRSRQSSTTADRDIKQFRIRSNADNALTLHPQTRTT